MLTVVSMTLSCATRQPPPTVHHDASRAPGAMEHVVVSTDGKGFVLQRSGRAFVPWGFNYDHDDPGRLLEEYWVKEWETVVEDFREMKQLGANVVRIHLQLGRFMKTPDTPHEHALRQLGRLVDLAERSRLYLDLTGLGCYLKSDLPDWYDSLSEQERWHVQARFWEAVAKTCARSPAVFCYDLMNEPVVPAHPRQPGDWLAPPFAGKYHFVQFISLDPAGRTRTEIARAWIRQLSDAIRRHDRQHLITVGLMPGTGFGFVPREIVGELDFLSVHLYPRSSDLDKSLRTLEQFEVGKPVVIEEMFPLNCSAPELGQFIADSKKLAAGWLGFYWGKTPAECRASTELRDKLVLAWLELFRQGAPVAGR